MNYPSSDTSLSLTGRGVRSGRESARGRGSLRSRPAEAFTWTDDAGRTRWLLGVGCLGVGLGLAQLLAPRRLAGLIGVPAGPRTVRLIRAGGALTTLAGVSLLTGWVGRRTAASRAAAQTPRTVRRSITIARSPGEVFAFWRDFQNLPRFMVHLESVEVHDALRSRWRARGPVGSSFEWNAEIVDERANELISWRSIGGSEVINSGVVRFRAAPGGRGTEVHVEATYAPPAGDLGRLIALASGEEPGQQIEGDLRRLKQVLEIGEVVESDASIHRGKHPARATAAPVIRKGEGS